jgi:hypothetical protein
VKCKLWWAKFTKPDQKWGKYGVTLGSLSDAAGAHLKSWGKKPKLDEDRPEYERHIKCTSKYPIEEVYLDDGTKFDGMIGNGSDAIVTLYLRDWSYNGDSGKALSIRKVVITELVPVELKSSEEAPVL